MCMCVCVCVNICLWGLWQHLLNQVIEVINRRPQIRKISFVAHSVGGLVARYAIGRLYRPRRKSQEEYEGCDSFDYKGSICGLEAVNFITVATPHLGSRGNKQVPFLSLLKFFRKFLLLRSCFDMTISLALSVSGKHVVFVYCFFLFPSLHKMLFLRCRVYLSSFLHYQ